MPVEIMKSVLTQVDYQKWVSYFQYKQPDIQEIQLAVLSTLVSNGLGGKAKVDDFLLSKQDSRMEDKAPKAMTEEEVRGAFAGFAIPME